MFVRIVVVKHRSGVKVLNSSPDPSFKKLMLSDTIAGSNLLDRHTVGHARQVQVEMLTGVVAAQRPDLCSNIEINVELLGDPEVTANICCKSLNLPNTDTQNYSTDICGDFWFTQ